MVIRDKISLQHVRSQICPICRTPFSLDTLVELQASVTQLTRVADSWKATIVDTLRYPLDDKVLYHECGEFNPSRVQMSVTYKDRNETPQ